MLTPADDYPLHQTPEPMAYAGSDRNFYDRFFFNGYSADGAVFFAAALGVYPQLNIMDASFALSYEGRQYNLRASKEMLGDRLALTVGPLTVEIVKPMRETRITLADNEGGLSGSLTAQARHEAIEEPRFTRRQGTRMMMDLTRATQNIDWAGTLDVRGEKIDSERLSRHARSQLGHSANRHGRTASTGAACAATILLAMDAEQFRRSGVFLSQQ